MKPNQSWTIDELKKLYELRHEKGMKFEEIEPFFKDKSHDSLRRKYARTNWDIFLRNPDGFFEMYSSNSSRKWTDDEMLQLDSFLQAGKSYSFIADKLNRNIGSVESRAQHTDWKAWRLIRKSAKDQKEEANVGEEKLVLLDQYITAMINVCRCDFKRLNSLTENEFLSRVNLDKEKLFIPYNELKQKTKDRLVEFGLGNPESLQLKCGTYIIVGDSHGKHTQKKMFSLLKNINSFLKPSKIIHVGHILDDDNDISYDWGNFDNLIILSKIEELRSIQEQRNKFKFRYNIVRDSLDIGELVIVNQDLISDFVKTPISNLDVEIFDEKVIVNCHRLEFTTRCCNQSASYFASPGCLCENHIIKTIKQIDFEDGHSIKQSFPDGYVKYRRMRHMNKYWEQGLLVVHVDKDGRHTIIPCSIKKIGDEFVTSYFDKMISSKGIFDPSNKIFVNGDMHCDLHDSSVLDIQEQICNRYRPNATVNVGDTFNYASLNHHVMDRGGVILDKKILDESAQAYFVLKRISKWAKKSYLIYGNHERFAKDFIERYPQFEQYLDFGFMCDLDGLGYNLTELKNVLKIGSAKFIHGEIKMYGQSGSKMEKASRTFGRDVFIGHIHRPEVRLGCYSVGLSGQLDQEYNEPDASNWLHGFGLCNQYCGQSWMTTIAIVDNSCIISGKTYVPSNPDSWTLPKYKARIKYDFSR